MRLDDGIDIFRQHADPRMVGDWIAKTAIWANPDAFKSLPVWAPYTFRKAPLYKAGWVDVQTNNKQPKFEGNVAANTALVAYLGMTKKNRTNWSCCHIWGNDDNLYQSGNSEVNDPRYFTCPANMILLPSPLKTFTDTVPEIKNTLRIMAHRLYGFCPEGRIIPDKKDCGAFFPSHWQNKEIPGVAQMSDAILTKLKKQVDKMKILRDLPASEYPKEQVSEVTTYWRRHVPGSLLDDLIV